MADNFGYIRLGQANLTGSTEALFRDKFVPELLAAFDEKRVIKEYVRHKTIDSGKSASFPVLGKTSAKYMGVGDRCLGNQTIGRNEITINLDPFLVTDIVLHELDLKMAHFDDRDEIRTEMARALANEEDRQLLQVGVLAARANGTVTGREGGAIIKKTGVSTDAALLTAAIFGAGVELDQKDVPDVDRACFVRPLQYSMLCQYENIADKNIGGGSYEKGTTGMLDNIKIVKTNHLPNKNIAQSSDTTKPNNVYYGDFSNTVALVMQKGAIGTISRQGLIVECSYNPEYFHHLITARVLQGHGILRPEAAVEIAEDPKKEEENDTTPSGTGDDSITGGSD